MKLTFGSAELKAKDYFDSVGYSRDEGRRVTITLDEKKTIEDLQQMIEEQFTGDFTLTPTNGDPVEYVNFLPSDISINGDDSSIRVTIAFSK